MNRPAAEPTLAASVPTPMALRAELEASASGRKINEIEMP